MIVQAANTGMTGGSSPQDGYDREVVIINTMRINMIHSIDEGKQVIAFAGSRLYELEALLQRYHRQPHSVIGSSCIGASVVGGICNNSGGALIQRGPAYTEMALYARINEDGSVHLMNHLGIDLGKTPEEILINLEQRCYTDQDIQQSDQLGSDHEYQKHVRDIDADTPSRFNQDPRRLFESSGCAGKLIVFAVRLDTFPRPAQKKTFYIGSNSPSTLTAIRRYILSQFQNLPESAFVLWPFFLPCDASRLYCQTRYGSRDG